VSKITDVHIWATVDGKHVEAGHPEARFLVAAPGDEVPDEDIVKKGKTPRNKAVSAPDDDKTTPDE
jgi:hypothetical protein